MPRVYPPGVPALVPTLAHTLARADATFRSGRTAAARRAYGDLLERAQDKSDRATEVIARIMLAWCAVRARDPEAARALLDACRDQLDPQHHEAYGRYRRVIGRMAVDAGPPELADRELRATLDWAEGQRRAGDALDACLLLAAMASGEARVTWLERGIEPALLAGATDDLPRAYNDLGAALDQLDAVDEALEAYGQALRWAQEAARADPTAAGMRRGVVAATWAVGAAACRADAWPTARDRLEEALRGAEGSDECADLVGWIRADLARVYEAAGDVVGARHQLVAALEAAREQELASLWPERYASLLAQARALDVG